MQDSIFTRIIKGEIPCHKVYEDAHTLAFLDINPLLPGHTLVVPKRQVDQFDELSTEDYEALMSAVKKLSRHLRTVLGTKRSVIQIFGFDVPHAHVHILPANAGTEYYESIARLVEETPQPYAPSQEELADMAAKLRLEDQS